jgi:hypothetical protein
METIQDQPTPPKVPITRVPVPNSQAILIMGIFSLVLAICCAGFLFVGLVLGIVAVIMSPKALETYQQNPALYTESSYKNINAGRICGIIGIILNGAMVLFGIIWLILMAAGIGTFFEAFPWEDYI